MKKGGEEWRKDGLKEEWREGGREGGREDGREAISKNILTFIIIMPVFILITFQLLYLS